MACWLDQDFGLAQKHWVIGLYLCAGKDTSAYYYVLDLFIFITKISQLTQFFASSSLTLQVLFLAALLVEKLAQHKLIPDLVSDIIWNFI